MSLLKTILKKIISPLIGAPTGKSKIPRESRIKLSPLHHLEFKRAEQKSLEILEISNISLTGVGFLRKSTQSWPEIGSIIKGTFRFGKVVYPITLRIAHISETIVGCRFEPPTDLLSKTLEKYFESELAGAKLNEVNPSILKSEPDGTPHWFYGKNNCELFYVETSDQVLRFNLCFFGNYAEGGIDQPVHYGSIIENNCFDKPRHRSADFVRFDETLTQENLSQLNRFVESITDLKPLHKQQILEFFKVISLVNHQ